MAQRRCVVIGGGLAGMSAAIRLAVDGHAVTILEKNERFGGKLNQRSGNGYTFDTGPSILTMPWVLDQLFASAGKQLSDYLTIVRVEPQWRTFFEDGSQIDISGDLPSLIEEIRRVSPTDAAHFMDYMQYCAKQYELSTHSFYKRSLAGLGELRKMHSLKELLAMDPLRSMHESTSRFIQDPRLRQLFDFFIMYIGSSPYSAPATLSQLVYVQLGLGIFYVQGGMYRIAQAMIKLAQELGVTLRTEAEVTEIISAGTRATGVRLKDGEVLEADVVVCNPEVIPAHASLLSTHPKAREEAVKLAKFAPTVSGLVLLLGVSQPFERIAHHNFFFSADPAKEFRQIFEEGQPADDPTVYVGVSSQTDATQAPEGKQNWFVLTHVPPLRQGESFAPLRDAYRERVLDKLERMGFAGLKEAIEWEDQFIPDDLAQLYGANGGSIYGVVTDRKQNGGFKIPSRSALLQNLYFVGGSTHPGGGVPMVSLSGQLTADLIAEDLAKQIG